MSLMLRSRRKGVRSLTSSQTAAAVDNQKPRLHSCPAYFSSLGQDAIDLASHAGLDLDPWQQYVLEESLGERANGKWASFEIGLIVPRQNGKGAVIEARQLAAMFLTRDPMIIYSAHQFKTAKQMYRRIRDLCKQTPELDKLVKGRYRQSNEETGIELDWGRMQFFARSNGSGRGFTGDTMFFDEAYNLDPELIADMLPTLAAVPNAQIWYVSSAGMESSEQLAKIRRRGIAGEDRLAYFEWSAPEGADLDDEQVWFEANPGLDIRLDRDFVRSVERNGMDDEKFARERLGIWHDPAAETVIDPKVWAKLASDGAEADDALPVVFAVDVPYDRSGVSIAVCGSEVSTGLPLVEALPRDSNGISWGVDKLAELHEKWSPAAIMLDAGGPAGALIAPLAEKGIEVVPLSTRELAQAFGVFFDRVSEGRMVHRGQPGLNAALSAAGKRTAGVDGAFMWQRKNSQDVTPVIAATLALYGWASQSVREPKKKQRSGRVW